MSGIRITDRQVRLYMTNRKSHTQETAAAKSGMSERTARRVEHNGKLPSQTPRRYWRSRPDPFADVWEREVVPLLRGAPKLKAITLLRKLQEDHPERFPDSTRRILERHISQWRALEGPGKEVFFPQTYEHFDADEEEEANPCDQLPVIDSPQDISEDLQEIMDSVFDNEEGEIESAKPSLVFRDTTGVSVRLAADMVRSSCCAAAVTNAYNSSSVMFIVNFKAKHLRL